MWDIFRSKKLLLLLFMGFASGLPFPLTHGTMQAWLTKAGLSNSDIGYISTIVAYPYVLKFVWAPLLDRYALPFLGLRRGWLIFSQAALVVLFCSAGFFNPQSGVYAFVALFFLMSFFSATQDIVIDAYRVEILEEKERGFAMTPAILGYRLALLVSGAYALYIVSKVGWDYLFIVMGGCMLLASLSTFAAPEPVKHAKPKPGLRDTFIAPLKELLQRAGAFEILAFIILYKIGDVLAAALTTPFMIRLGFSLEEIGAVTKLVGFLATIFGTLVGGMIMLRLNLKKALWLFGILQAISTISYLVLAETGKNNLVMAVCIALENFCGGLGTSAFTVFLMNICSSGFTATQYALLTSIMAFTHANAPAAAGKIVEKIGWSNLFILSTLLAIPGLLLLLRFDYWMGKEAIAEKAEIT